MSVAIATARPSSVAGTNPAAVPDPRVASLGAQPAALARDAALWRLARAESEADRELARGLALLWDRELYRPLGFVRATDFVREELGIKEGRARWLARLGRVLRTAPDIDQALVAGHISASHAIELGTVVDATTPAAERQAWIERAQGMSIRTLHRLVRRTRAERKQAVAGVVAKAATADAEEAAAVTVLDLSAGADLGAFAAGGDFAGPPAGGWMSIAAPARVAVLWHAAVELARAAAGRHLHHGQCAELIFAEYLSAQGATAESPKESKGDAVGSQRERFLDAVIAAMNREPHAAGAESAPVSATPGESRPLAPSDDGPASATARSPVLDWRHPEHQLPADCVCDEEADPWQIAATLARLAHLKKKLRLSIAVHLERLTADGSWRLLGFSSFADYCERRLGFGVRRAERLLRFQRGLHRFPRLEQAYLEGALSYTAALLLLPILHPATEPIWVRWADGITYRELERVVEFARTYTLPEAHPTVLASWIRGLRSQGLARQVEGQVESMAGAEATAFAATLGIASLGSATDPPLPLGVALPPTAPGALPRITGIPDDIALAPPELCIARIRFWLPADVRPLAHQALDAARHFLRQPLSPMWTSFELILLHFFHTHDTPLARALARRHRIIARDRYLCSCPGCTSRANLHAHHMRARAHGRLQ